LEEDLLFENSGNSESSISTGFLLKSGYETPGIRGGKRFIEQGTMNAQGITIETDEAVAHATNISSSGLGFLARQKGTGRGQDLVRARLANGLGEVQEIVERTGGFKRGKVQGPPRVWEGSG